MFKKFKLNKLFSTGLVLTALSFTNIPFNQNVYSAVPTIDTAALAQLIKQVQQTAEQIKKAQEFRENFLKNAREALGEQIKNVQALQGLTGTVEELKKTRQMWRDLQSAVEDTIQSAGNFQKSLAKFNYKEITDTFNLSGIRDDIAYAMFYDSPVNQKTAQREVDKHSDLLLSKLNSDLNEIARNSKVNLDVNGLTNSIKKECSVFAKAKYLYCVMNSIPASIDKASLDVQNLVQSRKQEQLQQLMKQADSIKDVTQASVFNNRVLIINTLYEIDRDLTNTYNQQRQADLRKVQKDMRLQYLALENRALAYAKEVEKDRRNKNFKKIESFTKEQLQQMLSR